MLVIALVVRGDQEDVVVFEGNIVEPFEIVYFGGKRERGL